MKRLIAVLMLYLALLGATQVRAMDGGQDQPTADHVSSQCGQADLRTVALEGVLAAAGLYHGNTESGVFHRQGCRWFNCGNCTAQFATREEALGAGYRPCKICRP